MSPLLQSLITPSFFLPFSFLPFPSFSFLPSPSSPPPFSFLPSSFLPFSRIGQKLSVPVVIKSSQSSPRGSCPVVSPPTSTHPGILLQIISFFLTYYQSIFIIFLTILATIGAIYVTHLVSITWVLDKGVLPLRV